MNALPPPSTSGEDIPPVAPAAHVGAQNGPDLVPFRAAVRAWFVISLQTFGGPAGQIAVMQHTLVDTKRWIGQRRFLHALNYCMLLPGPEAQQLAIYIGWLLNGTRGGLVAGTLFVLPGVVTLLTLSAIYVAYGDTVAVTAVFAGLAPAVLAIVAHAVWRVSRRALNHPALVGVAVAAFVGLAVFAVPFPVVIAVAAATGWVLHRVAPTIVTATRPSDTDSGPPPLIPDDAFHAERPTRRRQISILVIGLALWGVPVASLALYFATNTLFARAVTVHRGPVHALLPELGSIRLWSVMVTGVAVVLLFRVRWSALRVMGVCALLGIGGTLAGFIG